MKANYIAKIYAYHESEKKIVNLYEKYSLQFEGGRTVSYGDVVNLTIRHSVNEISTCKGAIAIFPAPKNLGNEYYYDESNAHVNFASFVHDAMNSNFQRNVYIDILLRQGNSRPNSFSDSEPMVVFRGVLTFMKACGKWKIPVKGGEIPNMEFEAKGSFFLEARVKKSFVPSYSEIEHMLSKAYPTREGKKAYSQDDRWKFEFGYNKAPNDSVLPLMYRPNMLVHNRSFFDYCNSIAKLNGCYFYVNDIDYTFSFITPIGRSSTKIISISKVDVLECVLVKSELAHRHTFEKYVVHTEDYSMPSSQKDMDEDQDIEMSDSSVVCSEKDSGQPLAEESKDSLNVYVPCYRFKEPDVDDNRLYPADKSTADMLAKRYNALAASKTSTAVIRIKPSAVKAANRICANPQPGDVLSCKSDAFNNDGIQFSTVNDKLVVSVEHQYNGRGDDVRIFLTLQDFF